MQRLLLAIVLLFVVGTVWYSHSSEYVGYLYNNNTISRDYLALAKDKLNFVSADVGDNLDSTFLRFAQKGVRIIIGPPLSSDSERILPYLQRYRMTALSATIASNKASKSGYVYSLTPSNSLLMPVLCNVLENIGTSNILLILDPNNTAYSDEFKILLSQYQGKGIYYYNKESLESLDLGSFDTAIFTVFTITAKQAADIIQLLKKANPNMRIIGTNSLLSMDVVTFGGKTAEGVLVLYTSEYTEYPEISLIDECVTIINSHRFISSEQFKRFLNHSVIRLENETIFFDENGVKRNIYLYRISDGKFRLITKW
ncbi:MAG TPA: ABC transporter substrate-binding protein [Fervidobacterium sp.]|nr:ABC transporter substrate-binding protein [Fervidobacterium sp.]HPT54039.1 ABC transporter substrate-binding protein [Fervidobacterium sp.]HPZ17409.1 ABC transporter substrate-binding protein [Fervidobacterium sp.]HQE48493.1 ABC transporter substrate-binding protein [Fervidobacterium sp.]HUM42268.1 ABC transporter substrate-binding protein [Fervidobacterium sp.]